MSSRYSIRQLWYHCCRFFFNPAFHPQLYSEVWPSAEHVVIRLFKFYLTNFIIPSPEQGQSSWPKLNQSCLIAIMTSRVLCWLWLESIFDQVSWQTLTGCQKPCTESSSPQPKLSWIRYCNSYVPKQSTPFLLYPELQRHSEEPGVLLQWVFALVAQSIWFSLHSSISTLIIIML